MNKVTQSHRVEEAQCDIARVVALRYNRRLICIILRHSNSLLTIALKARIQVNSIVVYRLIQLQAQTRSSTNSNKTKTRPYLQNNQSNSECTLVVAPQI